jgi:hypothetical protein
MLVRALKVLDYFGNETTSTGIDTAALDQPGDEVALMAEQSRIGNDEPWNRFVRHMSWTSPDAVNGAAKTGKK